MFGFNGSSENAYGFATGLPSASFINGVLSTNSNINAKLGTAPATVLGTGAEGAFAETNTTGAQEYISSADWTINATGLTGHLIAGLFGFQAFTTGFTSLEFSAVVGGSTVFDQTFATLASAETFFTNDALDLGTFAASSALAVDLNFDLKTSTSGTGFGGEFLLGTTGGNGPPVIAVPGPEIIGVSHTTAISGVSLSETGNTTGETFTVTLTDTNGHLAVTAGTGVTGNNSSSLSITGAIGFVNTELASLTDNDAVAGSDTVTLNATDSLGGTAVQKTIGMTINGLPTIAAPASATVNQNTATAVTGVSLSETGNTSGETFTVTLSDTNGNLSATGASGNGTHSISISGSFNTVNSDLATLTDTDPNTSADTIVVSASDSLGNSAVGKNIAVTVSAGNGPPVITAPATDTIGVGKAATISGVSISETGNTGSETFTVTLSDTHGLLSVAAGTGVTGNNSTSLSISGSLGFVNSELGGLSDTDATAGTETITLNASDSLGGTATPASVAVTVNGIPVIAAPATATTGVGQSTAIGGMSISETGNTGGTETFTTTLSDTNGHLSVTAGTGVSGNNSTNLSITGSLGFVNSELASLTDNDASTAADTIVVHATDSFGNAATAKNVSVTVNTAPALAAPATLVVGAGKAQAISGVSVSETGNTTTSGESFTVTVSDTSGVLNATGPGVTGNNSNSLTIAGSLTQVNADLATLKDTDSVTPSDTITLNASDSFGNVAPVETIAVTVNAAPIITVPASATVGAGQPQAIGGVSLSESGTTVGENFTVTLTDIHGLLSVAAGTGVTGNGTNSLQITGLLASVNSELSSLSDTDSTAGSDSITLNASDGFGNTAGTQTIAVTVNSVPVISAPTAATVTQSVATAISGVSLSESGNTGAPETFTATLSDGNGNLAVTAGTGVTGNNSHSLSITGSLTFVDNELATLTDNDANMAADTITLHATDSFGNAAAVKTIGVTVSTGGSPPVLSGGGNTVSWTLFGPNTVVDSGLAAADTESSTLSSATVSITAGLLAGDRLNFTNQNGITGSYNAGTGVLTLTGTASLANYQAALESITYSSTSLTPTNLGGDPTRTVTWQVNDGTANSSTITSTVDVNGVTGQTFFLTTNADTVVGTANNDLVIAATNTLSTSDVINGNGGTDTIALSGGGTFDLALPKTINGVQVIRAFEGQGATAQTLTLRAKTALTVDVASDVNGDASPTITIIGAANTDTINLGSGNDTVTLGGTGETVNGGGGDNTFDVTGRTIGAAIHGGSGTNALIVNGGGSAVMGGNIDGIATVELTGKTNFTANALSGLTITGDVAGNTVLLGASNQVFIGTGGGDKLTGVAGGLDVLRGTSAGLNLDSFSNFLPNDTIDITDLAPGKRGVHLDQDHRAAAGERRDGGRPRHAGTE